MAKFTKLNIGDAVASSGGRVWKKLSAKVALPEWNGIDLTGTTWYVPSGWSATSGYGKFNIADGQGDMQVDGEDFTHGGYIGIGYALSGSMRYTAKQDCFTFGESIMGWGGGTNAQAFTITIDGGADATNSKLITWLKQYGELLSHTMPTITFTIAGKSYQAEDGMTWYEWCVSEYNTGGYSCAGPNGRNKVFWSDGYMCVYLTGTDYVYDINNIIDNGTYIHKAFSGGGGAD